VESLLVLYWFHLSGQTRGATETAGTGRRSGGPALQRGEPEM